MKLSVRALLVSLVAIGMVGVASPIVHADDDEAYSPACADIESGGALYQGTVYIAGTDLEITQDSPLFTSVDKEASGTLLVQNALAAISCKSVSYVVSVTVESVTTDYVKRGDGKTDEVNFNISLARHSGYCVAVQAHTVARGRRTQDFAPTNAPQQVCADGSGGTGGWY